MDGEAEPLGYRWRHKTKTEHRHMCLIYYLTFSFPTSVYSSLSSMMFGNNYGIPHGLAGNMLDFILSFHVIFLSTSPDIPL